MIVVADTSPLNYLILVGHADLLPFLFGEVFIPGAVVVELQHPNAPSIVREWIERAPDWLSIRSPAEVDPRIRLGRGEAEAISLAGELAADLLLVDDRRARQLAESRGLSVAGTLNVLEAAAERGLIDLPAVIIQLRRTNFHISERILAKALSADEQRRRRRPAD